MDPSVGYGSAAPPDPPPMPDADQFEKTRSLILGYSTSIKDTFQSFDLNGDGSLSRVEFKHALVEMELEMDDLLFDELFLEMDADEDMEISFTDFEKFMNKTGSSALDPSMVGFVAGGSKFCL